MPDYRAGSWLHPSGGYRAGNPEYAALGGSVPFGYTVAIGQAAIVPANANALSFTFANAEIGATYQYTITSDGGAGQVTNSGVVGSATQQVSGIDVSGLPDGTLTLSVTLTNGAGTGLAATDTVTKDTTAPVGYNVSIDQALINAANDEALSFTFSGAEVGSSYAYSITSGAGSVSDTGTITTGADQVSGIDVSGLPDGTLTLAVTLTDPLGNEGPVAQATVQKDATAPSGYSVSINQSEIDETNHTQLRFTFAAAEVGATFAYTITSDGGGTPIAGGGTVTAIDQQVVVNVSSLPDGLLTLSVVLTDAAGNAGAAATDTVVKDTTDLTPNAFDLGARGGVNPESAQVESSVITVGGLGETATVTLSGDSSAEYQKNGGAWATAPTTAVNGDTFRVRVNASAAYNATTFAILTVGDFTDTFTVRTMKDPNAVPLTVGVQITRLHSRR